MDAIQQLGTVGQYFLGYSEAEVVRPAEQAEVYPAEANELFDAITASLRLSGLEINTLADESNTPRLTNRRREAERAETTHKMVRPW
jgi:hypothetical protein